MEIRERKKKYRTHSPGNGIKCAYTCCGGRYGRPNHRITIAVWGKVILDSLHCENTYKVNIVVMANY